MTNSNISTGRSISIAFAALVLLALAFSPATTRAADLPDSGSYDFYPDVASYDFYPDTASYDFYPDTYNDSYYSNPSYSSAPYSYYTPSYSTPSYSTPSYNSSSAASSVFAPTNTCTAPNSCNDNSVFNAPTVVTIQNTESQSRRSYDRDECNNCGSRNDRYYTEPYCNNCNRPVAYNPVPYVSLSATPYTGLELGPVGTAVYWGFLVLWSLIAAYLIVVKRVQVSIFRKLNTFLFGGEDVAPAQVALAGTPVHPEQSRRVSQISSAQDTVDDFILNQISRRRIA